MQPDFSKYDLEELEECLRSIDHSKYPERVSIIQERLDSLYAEEQERINNIPEQEREKMDRGGRIGGILTLVIGAILCSLYLYFGKIPTRSGDGLLREENPIMFYIFVGVIGWLFVCSAFSVWKKRFKKYRA
ncbi:hypothetical protein DRW07_14810 [Alteromonas sediminis]|uniref:Uncharacterized protein n=1 Tax=Alteromonas sediminis TaxID=2259342 RepID=A0A3N5Z9Q4_9ALTE|nr:hypothetical protein [Alteromonas sediminis]RPJ66068.1 hypothetical protein DRW07_14810 [Alteromonas sediminis]